MLLRITKAKYYKTHLKENKKQIENSIENY